MTIVFSFSDIETIRITNKKIIKKYILKEFEDLFFLCTQFHSFGLL